jgi:hypothetical protein
MLSSQDSWTLTRGLVKLGPGNADLPGPRFNLTSKGSGQACLENSDINCIPRNPNEKPRSKDRDYSSEIVPSP